MRTRRSPTFRSVGDERQTDATFDHDIIDRMGPTFYVAGFVPAITAARDEGIKNESILRRHPQGLKASPYMNAGAEAAVRWSRHRRSKPHSPLLACGQERPLAVLNPNESRTTIPLAAEPPALRASASGSPPARSWRSRGAAPGGCRGLRPPPLRCGLR